MTKEQLQESGAIFFEKIKDGMNEYKNVTLTMDSKMALRHFKSLKKEYGAEQSFADFYYFKLDPESQEMVDELLTAGEIEYLNLIRPFREDVEEELIFPLDDKLLNIIIKLNAEEMLFSTIYFLDSPTTGRKRSTWWGNYDHQYVSFIDK